MKRFRIGLKGRIFGVFKIDWCWTKRMTDRQVGIAEALRDWLDGAAVNAGPLKARLYVSVGSEV